MGGLFSTRWNGHARRRTVEEAPRVPIAEVAPRLGTPAAPGRRTVHAAGLALEVEAAPTNTGRLRWWWRCPTCGGRRAALYVRSGALRCRGCLRLAYWSQRCTPGDRHALRMRRIARRLGDTNPAGVPDLPPKPRGMHWATWERLAATFRDAEARRDVYFITSTLRFLEGHQ